MTRCWSASGDAPPVRLPSRVLLAVGQPRRLGSAQPRLTFGKDPTGPGQGPGDRVLSLDGTPAYELSSWCGSCHFLFHRRYGAFETLSLPALSRRLAHGLHTLDEDAIGAFSALLPEGVYLPLLLSIEPRLQMPSGPQDHFAHEQVDTWGLDPFWGCRTTRARPATAPSRRRSPTRPTCTSSSCRWCRRRWATAPPATGTRPGWPCPRTRPRSPSPRSTSRCPSTRLARTTARTGA